MLGYLKIAEEKPFKTLLFPEGEDDGMEDMQNQDESLNPLIAILGRLSSAKFLGDMLLQFAT